MINSTCLDSKSQKEPFVPLGKKRVLKPTPFRELGGVPVLCLPVYFCSDAFMSATNCSLLALNFLP